MLRNRQLYTFRTWSHKLARLASVPLPQAYVMRKDCWHWDSWAAQKVLRLDTRQTPVKLPRQDKILGGSKWLARHFQPPLSCLEPFSSHFPPTSASIYPPCSLKSITSLLIVIAYIYVYVYKYIFLNKLLSPSSICTCKYVWKIGHLVLNNQ